MFNVTDEEDKECWLSLVKNYSINEPARPFATEIIEKIKIMEKTFIEHIVGTMFIINI